MSFSVKIASRKNILENQKLVYDILKYIIKIDQNDIIITDSTLLSILVAEEDFIRDSMIYFDIKISPEQFNKLDMITYINLIKENKKYIV